MIIVPLFLAAQTMISAPEAVRKELDSACAGWQLAPVMPEIAAEIRTRTPTWPPNMMPGDFNGDRADRRCGARRMPAARAQLVAFLSNASGFTKHVLEQPQPYDPRAVPSPHSRSEYEHDAIGVEYEAVGGHAWVFRDGRWQSVVR